ncbi:membrane protein insertion efficiency factor YidD [Demetria terragena]|uniref:membrane protein insertion efficiency factor YidD n=1 Tax=Demetria terragena TaxID=63959 RepID=UPI00039F2CAF|nr:membrane protein insertion efficiency factor YidD [Demetria terragena]
MRSAKAERSTEQDDVVGLSRLLITPLVVIVRFYQKWISPMTPPTCRFTPSCSAYALTALRRHGLLRGTWLAIRRVLRCHPWNPGGVDHVPPRTGHRSSTPTTSPGSTIESAQPVLRNT